MHAFCRAATNFARAATNRAAQTMRRAAARLDSRLRALCCDNRPSTLESAPLKSAGPAFRPAGSRCGEVSEWLKEHAWKVCKRLNRASGVRIPLSPPVSQSRVARLREVSMVAPSAPRDARSKIPPGPEGSNGIDRRGCRGQPAGSRPFRAAPGTDPRFAAQTSGPAMRFQSPPLRGAPLPRGLSSRQALGSRT